MTFLLFMIATTALTGMELVKTSIPPEIDGKMEKTWEQAGENALVKFKTGAPARTPTTVRMLYDNHNLYLFIRCRELNIVEAFQSPHYKRHDAPIWNDECVEIFIDPLKDGKTYFQFIGNIHGDAAELLHNDPEKAKTPIAWNGFWRRAAGRYSEGWTFELAIPWRTLGVVPGKDSVSINVSRMRRVSPSERTVLAGKGKNLHDLAAFLKLSGLVIEKPLFHGSIIAGKSFVGDNRFELKITNQTAKTVSGFVELTGNDLDGNALFHAKKQISLPSGKEARETLTGQIDRPGGAQLTASFATLDGKKHFLAASTMVFRQAVELNDPHPIVFTGDDCTIYTRIFSDAQKNTLSAAVFDNNGKQHASVEYPDVSGKFFLKVPSNQLPSGSYVLKITFEQPAGKYTSSIPLLVIEKL